MADFTSGVETRILFILSCKEQFLLPLKLFTYLSGIMGNQRLTFFIIQGLSRDYTTPKRLKITYSSTTYLSGSRISIRLLILGRAWFTGLLSNQGAKKYKLLFHKGSFKKKILKYGTPKPSLCVPLMLNPLTVPSEEDSHTNTRQHSDTVTKTPKWQY